MFDAAHYRTQLLQLLPTGPAWPREPGSVLHQLIDAEAQELARVDGRLDALIAEFDPRTAFELLAEWEAALGLPDPCTAAATTVPARQAAIWRKLAFVGGSTPAFYIGLAAALGYAIEVHEFDPTVDSFDGTLTALIAGGKYRFVWRVHVLTAGDFTYFTFGDPFGGKFREGSSGVDLECIIRAAAPAHTHVIFTYP